MRHQRDAISIGLLVAGNIKFYVTVRSRKNNITLMFVIVRVVDTRITNDDENPRHFRMNPPRSFRNSFFLLVACRVCRAEKDTAQQEVNYSTKTRKYNPVWLMHPPLISIVAIKTYKQQKQARWQEQPGRKSESVASFCTPK